MSNPSQDETKSQQHKPLDSTTEEEEEQQQSGANRVCKQTKDTTTKTLTAPFFEYH